MNCLIKILSVVGLKIFCLISLICVSFVTLLIFNKCTEKKRKRWCMEIAMSFCFYLELGYILTLVSFILTSILPWKLSIILPYLFFVVYLIIVFIKKEKQDKNFVSINDMIL